MGKKPLQVGSKDNPAEIKVGDKIWIWPATEPTRFENELAIRLSNEDDIEDVVHLWICSISAEIAVQGDLEKKIELAGHSTRAIVARALDDDIAQFIDVELTYPIEDGGQQRILAKTHEHKFVDQYLLVVYCPFSQQKVDGTDIHRANCEIGLLACFFGPAAVFPPIYEGFYSRSREKFMSGELSVQTKGPFADLAMPFSGLADAHIELEAGNKKERRALSMVGRAVRTNEGVAKWVYYRAALEQAFGRNFMNAIGKYYSREPAALTVAIKSIKALKDLRDNVVHQADVGEYSAFDERVIQYVVLDGVFPRNDQEQHSQLSQVISIKSGKQA